MLYFFRTYLISILLTLIIGVILLMPTDDMHLPRQIWFEHSDKLVHAILFAILAVSLCVEGFRSYPSAPSPTSRFFSRVDAIAVVWPTIWGGVMELCQSFFTTTRSGDFWDLAFDILGCVLAWGVYKGVQLIRN